MPILTYITGRAVLFKKKPAIIANIMHNIFNIREAEDVICIIIVLLLRVKDLNHYTEIEIVYKAFDRHKSETIVKA